MGFRAPASSTRLSGAAPGSGGELGNPLAMSAAGRGQGGRDPPVSKVPSLPDAPTPRAANRKPLPPLQALPSVSGRRGRRRAREGARPPSRPVILRSWPRPPAAASVRRSCSSSPEATGSARRSPRPPTRRPRAPTPCCRSPCASSVAARPRRRKCASGGCSWWTWRARSGRPRCHARAPPAPPSPVTTTDLQSGPGPCPPVSSSISSAYKSTWLGEAPARCLSIE